MTTQVSYSRKHRVNMGKYEHVEYGGFVTLDVEDGDNPARSLAYAKELLDEAMAADIKEAHINTDEEDSFIHLKYDQTKGKN